MSDIATDVIRSLVREAMMTDTGDDLLVQEAIGSIAGRLVAGLEAEKGTSIVASLGLLVSDSEKPYDLGKKVASELVVAQFTISSDDFAAVKRKDSTYTVTLDGESYDRSLKDIPDQAISQDQINRITHIDLRDTLKRIPYFKEISRSEGGGVTVLSGNAIWMKCREKSSLLPVDEQVPDAIKNFSDLFASKISSVAAVLIVLQKIEERILVIKAIEEAESALEKAAAQDPSVEAKRANIIARAVKTAETEAQGKQASIQSALDFLEKTKTRITDALFALEVSDRTYEEGKRELIKKERGAAVRTLMSIFSGTTGRIDSPDDVKKGPLYLPLLNTFESILGAQGLSTKRGEINKGLTKKREDEAGNIIDIRSDIFNMTLREIAAVESLNMGRLVDEVTGRSSSVQRDVIRSLTPTIDRLLKRHKGEETIKGETVQAKLERRAAEEAEKMRAQEELGLGGGGSGRTRAVDTRAQLMMKSLAGSGSSSLAGIVAGIKSAPTGIVAPVSPAVEMWQRAAYDAFIRPIAAALAPFASTKSLAALSSKYDGPAVRKAAEARANAADLQRGGAGTTTGRVMGAEITTGGRPRLDDILASSTSRGISRLEALFQVGGIGRGGEEQEGRKLSRVEKVDYSILTDTAKALGGARRAIKESNDLAAALNERIKALKLIMDELDERPASFRSSVTDAVKNTFRGLGGSTAELIDDLARGKLRRPYHYIEGTALEPIRGSDVEAVEEVAEAASIPSVTDSPAVASAEESGPGLRRGEEGEVQYGTDNPLVVSARPETAEDEMRRKEMISQAMADLASAGAAPPPGPRRGRDGSSQEPEPPRLSPTSGGGTLFGGLDDLDEARLLEALRRSLLQRVGRSKRM